MSGNTFTQVNLHDYLKANDYVIDPKRLVTIRPEPGISITLKKCQIFDYEFYDRNEGDVVIVGGGVMGYDISGKKHMDMVLTSTIQVPIELLKEKYEAVN